MSIRGFVRAELDARIPSVTSTTKRRIACHGVSGVAVNYRLEGDATSTAL